MAASLLTRDNIDFVKRALRGTLPAVRASHRAEAFAAAAGFRTHAALLAALKGTGDDHPSFVNVDPARFAARLADFGHGGADGESLVGLVRSPALPAPLWREYRSGDRTANDRWFRACRRRDIPNVYIERRRIYAKLNWDCISIHPDGETHLRGAHGTALVEEMFRRFQSLARPDPGRAEFFGSAFVGSVDRLLPEIARDLADAFFTLLYAPTERHAAA